MATIGRISGQMLKDNLTRDGVDLAIETDLVYFDVNNKRVGIKTASPQYDLDVNGTTRSTNLEVSNTAHIGGVTISGNTIQSDSSVLALQPSGINSVVYNARAVIGTGLELEGNVIRTASTNSDIELQPNGTGSVNIYGNSTVYGNLHTTGNITADGNIQLGDQNTDAITFTADIASNLIPYNTNAFQLGSSSNRWKDLWVQNINAGTISGDIILANGVNIATTQGKIIYVATNGDDGNAGQHQNDPLASVGRALDLATAGDTVYIYPGTYEETIPLVVPAGVTVKGTGIRSVTIKPDSNTGEDIFHVTGEVTIEDLTVTGFNFNAGANKGYAFRFKPGAVVTTRSPYIRNITVITSGSVTSGTDPRGFAAGDAGKGALVDGSSVAVTSKEASMLFHSVTMITPGVDAITATNGARVEWLNSFTYFANKGIYSYTGTSGLGGDGKTRIKIATRTGTFNVGNTLSYYDTNGTTLLASGVIESIDGDFFNIDGKVLGFETLTDRATKTIYAIGDAKLSTAQQKFGSASLVLDGTGDYITADSQPDFAYGTGDFTLEFFWRPTAIGTQQILLDQRTAATDIALYLEMDTAGNIKLFVNGAYRITSSIACSAGAWNHVALFRTSGVTKLSINGTITPTTYTDTNDYQERPFRLGASWTGGTFSTGYFDELRIVKGVTKYTTSVTVPTAAFTSDADTILLLHFNGGNNSTIIVDDGVTTQDIRTSAGGTAKKIDVADYTDFGCEMRAIASANVYGNYGAYADGVGNILYLVSQNFAYIGTGKDSNNDPTAVIQANEVYTANGAKIYYSSVDHQGDFRVGDLFYVDQKNGNVTFSAETFNINSLTGVTFTDGTDTTIIDATKVETGNIRISGNDIISITGNIGIAPANGQLNIAGTTNISGNNNITGNLSVTGNTTIGDANTDTLTLNSKIIGNLVPNTTGVYNLGSSSLNWENMYGTKVVIDDLEITGNVIRTTTSNANLELNANGTGSIIIDSLKFTNASISTVNTNTDINVSPTGTGIVNVTSAIVTTGSATISGALTAQTNVSLGSTSANTLTINSRIIGDIVPTTTSTYTLGSSTLKWANLFVGNVLVDDIQINDNYITTTASNANLELRANGTGAVRVDQLDIKSNTILSNTLNGNINLTANGTGSVIVTSPLTVQGALTVNAATNFNGSVTLGDTSSDVINVIGQITGNLIPTATATYDIGSNGLRWQNIYAGNVYVDDLLLSDNVISTTISNSNLELRGNATGSVRIDQLDFKNNIVSANTANTDIQLQSTGTGSIRLNSNTDITGNLSVTGNITLGGNIQIGDQTSDTISFVGSVNSSIIPIVSASYDLGSNAQRWRTLYAGNVYVDDILLTDNFISTTASNANLELRGNGTGSVRIDQLDVKSNSITANTTNTDINVSPTGTGSVKLNSNTDITGNLTVSSNLVVNGNTTLGDSVADIINIIGSLTGNIVPNVTATYDIGSNGLRWQNIYAGNVIVDDILITDNYIATTASNSNLELRGNATGSVRIDQLDIKTNSITANSSNTNINISPSGTGAVKLNANTDVTGILTVSSNLVINGNTTLGDASTDTINVVGSITGNIIPTATATYDIGSNSLRWQNIYAGNVYVDDILITDNYIATTISNSNLELRGNGTGSVRIDQLDIKTNSITANTANTDINVSPTGTGSVKLNSNTDVTGNLTVSSNLVVNGNTTLGDSGADTINIVGSLTGNIVPNVTATYDIGSSGLRWQNIYAGNVYVDDILITDNYVATTASNANLELRGNGSGSVRIDQLDVKNNLISTNTAATDLRIQATGAIKLLSNTDVTGSITTSGDLVVNGNTTLGDATTDSVNVVGRFISNLTPSTTLARDLGTSSLQWRTVYTGLNIVDQIEINDNYIKTTTTNGNLELRPNGTGSIRIDSLDIRSNIISANTANTDIRVQPSGTGIVRLQATTAVTGDVTASGNLVVNGNTTLGDATTDTINTIGRFVNNLVPNATTSYDLGTSGLVWRNIYAGAVYVDDIQINDNYITTTASNANLELRGNGTGSVRIDSIDIKGSTFTANTANTDISIQPTGTGIVRLLKDTDITGNLNVTGNISLTGNITVGDAGTDTININGTLSNSLVPTTTATYDIGSNSLRWKTLYAGRIIVDDIEINDNYITTTASNANLELRANGTGSILLEDLTVNQTTISSVNTNQDITLTPTGTGVVRFNTTQAVVLPTGTELQRPTTPSAGMIRFNSTQNTYEGYQGAYWVQLGGISSVNRKTRITPESTIGANDNVIRFYTDDVLSASLSSTALSVNALVVDDLQINNNTISTVTTNTDLEFAPNGTGSVVIDNLKITNNTITNTLSNGVTQFVSTGLGYYKIAGTNGVVIPTGGSLQRPSVVAVGMIRYNTDLGLTEIWDGAQWSSVAGASSGINASQAEDIAIGIALSFG